MPILSQTDQTACLNCLCILNWYKRKYFKVLKITHFGFQNVQQWCLLECIIAKTSVEGLQITGNKYAASTVKLLLCSRFYFINIICKFKSNVLSRDNGQIGLIISVTWVIAITYL